MKQTKKINDDNNNSFLYIHAIEMLLITLVHSKTGLND